MAEIRQEMRRFLMQDSTVTGALDQVYVDHLPDNVTYACALLRDVTAPLTYNFSGSHLRKTLVQIDIYAETISDKNTARDAIQGRLDGHKGMMGTIETGFVFVQDAGRDSYEKDAQLYTKVMEVQVAG